MWIYFCSWNILYISKITPLKEKRILFYRSYHLKIQVYGCFFLLLHFHLFAKILQSIGFFITDVFSDEKDLPLVISLTFVVLSLSTVVSQYIFTDMKPISNDKLLIYGTFLILISYIMAALSSSIALFFYSQLSGSGSLDLQMHLLYH